MITAKNGTGNYVVEISDGTRTVQADVGPDKGGGSAGFRPHDLLAAAYASCLNISARVVLDRLNLPYSDVRVQVDVDRDTEGKTIFRSRMEIEGDLSSEDRRKVAELTSNCQVRKTLSRQIEFAPLA